MKVRTATRRAKPCGPICSTGLTPARRVPRQCRGARPARPIRCSSPSSTMPRAARSATRPSCASIRPTASSRSATSCTRQRCSGRAGATEAQYLFARYVFDELGYRRYEWKCNALNAPSRRAAERFGFTFEGIFRQHMIVKGRNRDTAWFAMLDSEWPARKAAYERWLAAGQFRFRRAAKDRALGLMPKGNG